MSLPDDEIDVRFQYHRPSDGQQVLMASIREDIRNLAHALNKLLPDCRETSLVFTHLEQAHLYINAAIARRDRR